MPGPDVTPEQLRSRTWWSGPELFVLVDDYDLVATAAATRWLRCWTTCRRPATSACTWSWRDDRGRRPGALRAGAREGAGTGAVGLVMAGSRDEGALIGSARASEMPAGRGTLITRAGSSLIQVAWLDAL